MQPSDETYILYGALFIFVMLGLLFNVVKRLGSSKNFPPNKDKKNNWSGPKCYFLIYPHKDFLFNKIAAFHLGTDKRIWIVL